MGTLFNFCAGASAINSLPWQNLDGLLINVPDAGRNSTSIRRTEKFIQYATPRYLMLDSGGYSLLKAEEAGKDIIFDESKPIYGANFFNLTPKHVVDLAVYISPHILVALDFPIQKIKGASAQEIEFQKKLGINVSWAIQTSILRDKYCPHIRLFIPIQCYTLAHLEEFLYFIRDISHENLCMPVRNWTLDEIAGFMLRFYQIGVTQVHLLGVGAFFEIALASYMARNYFDWISLDAQTWRLEATFHRYLNPHDLSRENIREGMRIDPNLEMDCPCPFCQGKTFTFIRDLPFTEKTRFLMQHNYWVTENIARELYENAGSLWGFRKFLLRKARRIQKVEELYKALSRFDLQAQASNGLLNLANG
jgi:tRNA-guanine family transglycosylase